MRDCGAHRLALHDLGVLMDLTTLTALVIILSMWALFFGRL